MDRVHDLGGRHIQDPIETDAPPFSQEWEERMWAISELTGASSGNIDWWRSTLEQLPPEVYRSIPYFEKWCLTNLATHLCAGDFTMAEVLAGRVDHRQTTATEMGRDGALEAIKSLEIFFDRDADAPPSFAVGDPVRTVPTITSRHTRLPAYAQGRSGTILAYRGSHAFADASARGEEIGQHLYTVEFRATELWGAEADPRDSVTLDLWESYLVRP